MNSELFAAFLSTLTNHCSAAIIGLKRRLFNEGNQYDDTDDFMTSHGKKKRRGGKLFMKVLLAEQVMSEDWIKQGALVRGRTSHLIKSEKQYYNCKVKKCTKTAYIVP